MAKNDDTVSYILRQNLIPYDYDSYNMIPRKMHIIIQNLKKANRFWGYSGRFQKRYHAII
jgi:hypothetical protein